MKTSKFARARLACAYFFLCPGLAYGTFTARLPALRDQAGIDEAQIGLLLLCFGAASLVGLAASGWCIARYGSRLILSIGVIALMIAMPLCGLGGDAASIAIPLAFAGLGTGLADVAMNTQGIQLERRFSTSSMVFLHASYSLGGVAGSIAGALFSALGLGVFPNAVCILGLYACLLPWAMPRLLHDMPAAASQNTGNPTSRGIPLFVAFCGLMAMMTFAADGSVGEWGALLLVTVKEASQATAACVYAVFSATTVLCRFFGDRLRESCGDAAITFGGALLAVGGMSLVLFAGNPLVCLGGYALMGAGLSPIVPILFSRAGRHPGISASRASTVVSVVGYAGLLLFPPLLGFVARHAGLENALFIVLALCALIAGGTLFLNKRNAPAF